MGLSAKQKGGNFRRLQISASVGKRGRDEKRAGIASPHPPGITKRRKAPLELHDAHEKFDLNKMVRLVQIAKCGAL
jgi:hypothetical protein